MYKFEYTDFMKQYRKENNVQNTIASVQLKDKNQTKNKRPQFVISLQSNVGTFENTVKTTNLSDNRYEVEDGWGQLTHGRITKV
jgi:hypothetical protein